MSSRKILLNGVTYVRSRDSARAVNLTPNYVSTLARQGVIGRTCVGNVWFIEPSSLQAFIAEQDRKKVLWRARLAQMRREEQRAAKHPSAFFA